MKDSFKKSGYDLEEAYFQKLNQELIEKLKSEKKKDHLKLVVNNESRQEQNLSEESVPKRKKAA